ncbi:MAG: hypothetical protein U0841_10995 [Chloroflexia bacterium]
MLLVHVLHDRDLELARQNEEIASIERMVSEAQLPQALGPPMVSIAAVRGAAAARSVRSPKPW